MSTRTTIGIGVLGAMGIGLLIASAAGMRGTTAVAVQEAPSAVAALGDVSSGTALAPSPSNGSNELTLTNYVEVQAQHYPGLGCCPCPPTSGCFLSPCAQIHVYVTEADVLSCGKDANGDRWLTISAPAACDLDGCPDEQCVTVPSSYSTTTDTSNGCVWTLDACHKSCAACWKFYCG